MPSKQANTATATVLDEERLAEAAAHLRTAIVRTNRSLRREAAGETGGLTQTAVATLATIERHGPLTPSEAATIERVRRPSMTRTLACLEQEGLIERMPDPEDGRSFLVSVNVAGRAQMKRLRRRKTAYLAQRLRDLSPEEVETLERATEILERMGATGEGEQG
jgi:DNA-binding MarR family transcriptional regulator